MKKYRTVFRGLIIGVVAGLILGIIIDASNSKKGKYGVITHKGKYVATTIRKDTGPVTLNSIIAGAFIGAFIGLLFVKKDSNLDAAKERANKNWSNYKGGWGTKIPGGSENNREHISVTNKEARVGKGFHITVGDNHLYYDEKGNYLGEGDETYTILEKIASMQKRGVISDKEYNAALEKLSKNKTNDGIEI